MPEFEFNKLVRDKLREEYERIGQKATYRELSESAHKLMLIEKNIEELREIDITAPKDKIIEELADAKQANNNFMTLCDITDEQVESARQAKYDKKGGFLGGTFVETLELADDDEWVNYYRENPDVYPEKK